MKFSETFYTRNSESLRDIPVDELLSLIKPKTELAISLDGLIERIRNGEKLNVKFGTDPTGPDLHLGHIVPIRVLDLFSRAGHNIDLIFGDFTAKVGDPTFRNKERPILTDEDIAQNMSTFRDQVNRYFDTYAENVRIHQNSKWLGRMALSETFGYLQAINLTEATQREDFRKRMQNGQAVSLAEAIYGTLMGIDSVYLKTDVEIGGIDQLLNFQQTRAVQRSKSQKAEEILMTPLIEGTSGDGQKMSKSYGNYIPVRADADEVYGKFMSIPDNLIVPYAKAFAPVYEADVQRLEQAVQDNPLEIKKQLATYMAATSSGSFDKGLDAREGFERRFASKKITTEDAKQLSLGRSLTDTLLGSGDFKSRSEIRRLAEQGGIKVDGSKVTVEELDVAMGAGSLITVGKRKVYTVSSDAPS